MEELWPGLAAFSREAKKHRVIESREGERLVWEIQEFTCTRRFEADLAPSALGCRLSLKQQALGPLGWFFTLFCARRWKQDMAATARRLAGGTGRC